ncbi:hypothetical protein llg_39530 [Luteolibacter sp. LG18]|nr:hypothetical protein llg_39530 [Luteolibacter sp. LG18]
MKRYAEVPGDKGSALYPAQPDSATATTKGSGKRTKRIRACKPRPARVAIRRGSDYAIVIWFNDQGRSDSRPLEKLGQPFDIPGRQTRLPTGSVETMITPTHLTPYPLDDENRSFPWPTGDLMKHREW